MVINSNNSALNTSRLLGQSSQALSKSLARLSSGSKIVSPEDDSAGLAQSIKLSNQSLRDNAAHQVLENGISFLQTKDGFLQKVQKGLDRMSELSVLAQDATKTDNDRSNYNAEFQTLISFINDIGTKDFNGKSLFYSEYSLVSTGSDITWSAANAAAEAAGGHLATITSPGEQSFLAAQLGGTVSEAAWIGATDEVTEGTFEWVTGEAFLYNNWNTGEPNDAGGNEDYVQLLPGTNGKWNDLPDSYAGLQAYVLEKGSSLVINGDADTIDLPSEGIPYLTDTLATTSAAQTALTNVKNAIENIARARGTVGAILQRVQAESETVSIAAQNLDAAVSRIRDVDVAEESTNFARQSILTQSGTTMLAQANLMPQSVLRLLG
jgi:flagellin